MRRQAVRVLLATVFALPLAGAGNAAAAPVDLVCPFAATIHFSPGLGLTPTLQHITGTTAYGLAASPFTPCSSLLTGVPYTGATGPVSGTGMLACVAAGVSGVLASASGTVQSTWNTGDTSTISWSVTVGGLVTSIDATVTSGALQGSRVALAGVPTGLTGNCITPLTSLSVSGLLPFVGLPASRTRAARVRPTPRRLRGPARSERRTAR